jgi:hypothetical protein
MNGKTLLETYPKAAEVIRKYFMEKLLESLNDADLPEDFKEFARQREIDDDRVAELIDAQPRGLFDVLDTNEVFVEITIIIGANPFFIYAINGKSYDEFPYKTRIESERSAITEALHILNNKL